MAFHFPSLTSPLTRRAALALTATAAHSASQDATPGPLANHPIIGVWLVRNATVPPSRSTVILGADESVLVDSVVSSKAPGRGRGACQRTDRHFGAHRPAKFNEIVLAFLAVETSATPTA